MAGPRLTEEQAGDIAASAGLLLEALKKEFSGGYLSPDFLARAIGGAMGVLTEIAVYQDQRDED